MPRYDYHCPENNETVEVIHSIQFKLATWGEVCEKSGRDLAGISASAPVDRVILTPPMANMPVGNAGLKDLGFTKLVKRDNGVYENVTKGVSEEKYMRSGDPSSMPHFSKKISD